MPNGKKTKDFISSSATQMEQDESLVLNWDLFIGVGLEDGQQRQRLVLGQEVVLQVDDMDDGGEEEGDEDQHPAVHRCQDFSLSFGGRVGGGLLSGSEWPRMSRVDQDEDRAKFQQQLSMQNLL